MNAHIFELIAKSDIYQFFTAGFVSGIVGYLWYLWTSRNDKGNHLNWLIGLYGTLLSGLLGGLLAIVFDRNIRLSIIVGLLNQFIYMAIVRSAKQGDFFKVIKEVLLRYLTGGK